MLIDICGKNVFYCHINVVGSYDSKNVIGIYESLIVCQVTCPMIFILGHINTETKEERMWA